MNLTIEIQNQIPENVEKYIIKLINKKKSYKSYGEISSKEISYIKYHIKIKFNIKINSQIIISIKSAYMKNYMINNYYKLKLYSKKLIQEYPTNNIIKLCSKYDISPMTILRFILESKYKLKIKYIILNLDILSSYDLEQLKLAIKSDIYNLLDQNSISIAATEFENKIEKILTKLNIKFRTQQELTIEQIKLYNKPINTPDFLIDSELIINNIKINWIDAKNFYGSNIPFVKKKIEKQIKKYINTYGSGCIIFRSFSSGLKFSNVLLLSYKSIKNIV
jgi:hypothetical protein